jgi:serralysin
MAVIQGNDTSEVLTGTNSSDTISGAGGNDALYGRGGDDILDGGAGNDFLDGGSGDDDLTGGTGYNDLRGGSGLDLIIMSARGAAGFSDDLVYDSTFDEDRVDLSAWGVSDFSQVQALLTWDSTGSATLDAFYGGLDHVLTLDGIRPGDLIATDFIYANPGALNVTGTNADDVLFGSRNNDILRGNGGSDVLLGGLGDDILYGGAGFNDLIGGTGNDFYFVSDAHDFVFEGTGEGAGDRVFASVNFVLNQGAQVEIMSTDNHAGTIALTLKGNELAQTIIGNAGANVLDGKGGQDVLVGGAGADVFAFSTTPGAANADRIADFAHGSDRIGLDDAVFHGIGGPGALNPAAFFAGTAAHDADDRIIYDQASGNLFYDADGNGAHAAILFANLSTHPLVSAGDFTVI